jgi:hypothetical protein
MALRSRSLLVVAVLALGCGQKSGGAKIAGMSDDGAAPPPGQEAGPSGTRGGGGGAFGGGNDPDADASDAQATAGDVASATVDATPDLARDRSRDTSFTPVDAVTAVDSGASGDLSSDLCSGTCAMYESEYAGALVRARVCNPIAKLQCQMTASTGLHCPGCKIWVTSTVELADIRAKWAGAGCQTCSNILCSQIACRALTTGVCHSRMLAAPPDPGMPIIGPPIQTGSCLDQSDPTTP